MRKAAMTGFAEGSFVERSCLSNAYLKSRKDKNLREGRKALHVGLSMSCRIYDLS